MRQNTIMLLLTILLLALVIGIAFAGGGGGRQCNHRNMDGENTGACVDDHIINYYLYMTCGWALIDHQCKNDHECISMVVHTYDAHEGEPCTVELPDSPSETRKACCATAP